MIDAFFPPSFMKQKPGTKKTFKLKMGKRMHERIENNLETQQNNKWIRKQTKWDKKIIGECKR